MRLPAIAFNSFLTRFIKHTESGTTATEMLAAPKPIFPEKWHSGDRNMWRNGHRNDSNSLALYHRNDWHNGDRIIHYIQDLYKIAQIRKLLV